MYEYTWISTYGIIARQKANSYKEALELAFDKLLAERISNPISRLVYESDTKILWCDQYWYETSRLGLQETAALIIQETTSDALKIKKFDHFVYLFNIKNTEEFAKQCGFQTAHDVRPIK